MLHYIQRYVILTPNNGIKDSHTHEPAFNIFFNEYLVAEVHENDTARLTVIPMRELNNYEPGKLMNIYKQCF